MLKAYQVLGERGEDYGDIVYANTREAARVNCVAYVEHGQPYSLCKATRKPEFDQYQDQAEWNYNNTAKTIMLNEIKVTH